MSPPAVRLLRLSRTGARTIWFLWLCVAVTLSIPPLWRHFDYARAGHPSIFWLFAGFVFAVPFVVTPLYQRVRTPSVRRLEPCLLLFVLVVAPLAYEPLATLTVGWLFLAAYVAGGTLMARIRPSSLSPLAQCSYSFATGFGILALPLALLGHFQVYRPWALIALLAALTALGWRQIPELLKMPLKLMERWSAGADTGRLAAALIIVLALVLAASGLAVALAPSITFDPLRFHLPLARHYAETGGLDVLTSDGYGYNPQNFELLLALGWVLGGQPAAQLITPAFSILFLLALFAAGRRMGLSRVAAGLGAVLAMAVPYVHWTGVNVKHDLIVGFFHLAGLLAYFEWRRTGATGWIYLGAFFAATSFGFKHPAAFGILGLAVLYIHAAWRHPRRWRAFAVCALIFFAAGTMWQMRSALLTGDPFYYYDLDQPLPGDHEAQVGSIGHRIRTIVTWPWRIHFDGQLFFRSDTDNPAGIVLLVFAPAWFLVRGRLSSEARAAVVFAAVSLLLWCAYVPLLRFVIAPLSILVMLTVGRVREWYEGGGSATRFTLRFAAGWSVAFSLCVMLILEVNSPQIKYYTGRIDRQGYLREALQTYRSLEFLSRHADPSDRILGIRNCSMAYAPNPSNFFCRYFDLNARDQIEEVEAAFRKPFFEWIVFPSTPRWEETVDRLSRPHGLKRVFTGEHYAVSRLTRPE